MAFLVFRIVRLTLTDFVLIIPYLRTPLLINFRFPFIYSGQTRYWIRRIQIIGKKTIPYYG